MPTCKQVRAHGWQFMPSIDLGAPRTLAVHHSRRVVEAFFFFLHLLSGLPSYKTSCLAFHGSRMRRLSHVSCMHPPICW